NLGFTDLSANLKKKVIFEFITDPQEIIPGLFTLGEISERNEDVLARILFLFLIKNLAKRFPDQCMSVIF
ncbi:MAG: hypothetical protein LC660_04225, partial [Desulfobacteraceae bacterium]|nr:hypothetical protein [Desulfobacteraceae bacterium]